MIESVKSSSIPRSILGSIHGNNISLYSLLGSLIYQSKIENNKIQINLSKEKS